MSGIVRIEQLREMPDLYGVASRDKAPGGVQVPPDFSVFGFQFERIDDDRLHLNGPNESISVTGPSRTKVLEILMTAGGTCVDDVVIAEAILPDAKYIRGPEGHDARKNVTNMVNSARNSIKGITLDVEVIKPVNPLVGKLPTTRRIIDGSNPEALVPAMVDLSVPLSEEIIRESLMYPAGLVPESGGRVLHGPHGSYSVEERFTHILYALLRHNGEPLTLNDLADIQYEQRGWTPGSRSPSRLESDIHQVLEGVSHVLGRVNTDNDGQGRNYFELVWSEQPKPRPVAKVTPPLRQLDQIVVEGRDGVNFSHRERDIIFAYTTDTLQALRDKLLSPEYGMRDEDFVRTVGSAFQKLMEASGKSLQEIRDLLTVINPKAQETEKENEAVVVDSNTFTSDVTDVLTEIETKTFKRLCIEGLSLDQIVTADGVSKDTIYKRVGTIGRKLAAAGKHAGQDEMTSRISVYQELAKSVFSRPGKVQKDFEKIFGSISPIDLYQLTELNRAVFMLSQVAGMDYKSVASMCNIDRPEYVFEINRRVRIQLTKLVRDRHSRNWADDPQPLDSFGTYCDTR